MKKNIEKIIQEHISKEMFDEFEEALSDLATLDLEDDQVRIPPFDEETDDYVFSVGNVYVHIRKREELPSSGAFELFIVNNDDEVIGFIRGTKGGKMVSFNLIYIEPEERGWGIGTDIYKYFLDNGYVIKSDDEITDSTQSLYLNLVKAGYIPLFFDDGRVGLKKK